MHYVQKTQRPFLKLMLSGFIYLFNNKWVHACNWKWIYYTSITLISNCMTLLWTAVAPKLNNCFAIFHLLLPACPHSCHCPIMLLCLNLDSLVITKSFSLNVVEMVMPLKFTLLSLLFRTKSHWCLRHIAHLLALLACSFHSTCHQLSSDLSI